MNFDHQLLDNLFGPLLIINQKKKIKYFNHHFTIYSGFSPRKLNKDVSFKEILATPFAPIDSLIKKAIKNNNISLSQELTIQFKDNPHQLHAVLKLIPYQLEKEKSIIISFNDLSVERQLYDKYKQKLNELKSTYQQILQANKLSTLGELTANVTHEISNPLSVAIGHTEILKLSLHQEDLNTVKKTIKKHLHNLHNSHIKMNEILNNMKSYLYHSEDKKEYCDLDKILQSSIDLVYPLLNKGHISIVRQTQGNNFIVFVNKIKIEQVIINLLKNSIDAITSNQISKGKIKITLTRNKDDNFIDMDLIDNGPGINAKIREEIFNPFFTTKDVGEGTGLGLTICNKIIESHQGEITIVDKKQKAGAHFKIKLPFIEIGSYTQNERLTNNLTCENDRPKLLVIDDDIQVLNVLFNFLQDDYTFIGSTNGLEAISFLENIEVDLILTDYQMPDMNGSEFSQKIREKNIICPIFYLTSAKNLQYFQRDKEIYDVLGLILKPFTRNEVLKTIKRALEKK